MRSSFRSWCSDTGVSREIAEMCLAHVVPGVEGAYQRSDLYKARVEVMQAVGGLYFLKIFFLVFTPQHLVDSLRIL